MGAWNEDPTGNDEAQEWLTDFFETPLVGAISNAIDGFLLDASDDVKKAEAEAAVALLLDLSNKSTFKYVQINFDYSVRERGLWGKCKTVILHLQSDEKWLSEWGDSKKKRDVLNGLLRGVEASEAENGQT